MTTSLRFHHILALVLGLVAVGCATEPPTDEIEPLTKEEAAARSGKSDDGTDFCELFLWYGDNYCDPFCPRPDPDCAATPSCGELMGRCLASFQFPTEKPSCEAEYNLVTAVGTCAQATESCCVAP